MTPSPNASRSCEAFYTWQPEFAKPASFAGYCGSYSNVAKKTCKEEYRYM